MNCPLFPLSSYILPSGRMALRIFEQRYIRMVKEACASQQWFVICMLNEEGSKENNTHIYDVGTYCKVIDFSILDDGLLGITVEGIERVRISNITTQSDGLRVGDCDELPNWTFDNEVARMDTIQGRLREIYQCYPDVSNLYDELALDDPVWVVNRWLELLPVDTIKKQRLLEQTDCKDAVNYLSKIIE